MCNSAWNIISCPLSLAPKALDLACGDWTLEQRAAVLAKSVANGHDNVQGLFVAVSDSDSSEEPEKMLDAAYLQLQPGKTALLCLANQAEEITRALLGPAIEFAEANRCDLVQTVLEQPTTENASLLAKNGFQHLAKLRYLWNDLQNLPTADRRSADVEFEPYAEQHRTRLGEVISQTYQGSLDCPMLDGVRSIDDVIDGYSATGRHGSGRWFFVKQRGQDSGVLILGQHPVVAKSSGSASESNLFQWELIYMGITPEARGQSLGAAIVGFAIECAVKSDAQGIMLAVDVENQPAIDIYERQGFTILGQRDVFVRSL